MKRCESCGSEYEPTRGWCDCGAELPAVVEDQGDATGFTIPPDMQPQQELVYLIDQMLDNPVDQHGNHYDLRYLKPLLAFHLARCWPTRYGGVPVVKRREYPGGYVEWVKLDAPDLEADPFDGLTLAELQELPPEQRDAAIRRLQAGEDVGDMDDRIPWKVRTNIQFDEESLR